MDDLAGVYSIYIISALFSYNEEYSAAENAKARAAFDPILGYRSSKISHENR